MAVRVLNQLGRGMSDAIAAAVPEAQVIDIPARGPLDEDVHGDVLLALNSSDNLLEAAGRGVTWVHAFATGVDWLPPELFEGRRVTCSRGATAVPIAEYCLAAMLAYEKQIPEIFVSEPPERMSLARLGTLEGAQLSLVGLGSIGGALAVRALACGMRVRAVRRTDAPSPVPGVEVVAGLEELLPGARHLVIAAPATERTRHLIDANALQMVEPGVHLVNVARGSLVDHDALLHALDDGRIGRATLDVTDPEPLPVDHRLYAHPRVRVSAHVSWSGPGVFENMTRLFLENLEGFAAGRDLRGVVDPFERY